MVLLILILISTLCKVRGDEFEGFSDMSEMPIPRSDMTATLFDGEMFDDGMGARIYLVGGCAGDQVCGTEDGWCFCPLLTNKCEYFLPSQDLWVDCADAPRERYRFAAAKSNGKLYLVGGRDVDDSIVQEVDMYDPVTDTWTTPYTWNEATSDNGAFADGDFLYLVGGYNADYSVASNALTRLSTVDWTMVDLASMSVGRGDVGVTSVPDEVGTVSHFVIGGAGVNFCNMLASVERYNIQSDTWTTLEDLLLPRADMALGVIDHHLFVVAGETKDDSCDFSTFSPGASIPVDDVERLSSFSWHVEEGIPSERFRFVGASYGQQIFLFGGQAAHTVEVVVNNTVERVYRLLNSTTRYEPLSIRMGAAGYSTPSVVFLGALLFVFLA